MNIKGGSGGQPGNPFDREDEGIFISKINPSGAAARDGRLQPGMRIIEVNDVSLLGASHAEAVSSLRNTGNRIVLLVCDGYDPDSVKVEAIQPAITQNYSNSTSHGPSENYTSPVIGGTNEANKEHIDDETANFSPSRANESQQLSANSLASKTEQKTTTVIMKKHQTSSMVCT